MNRRFVLALTLAALLAISRPGLAQTSGQGGATTRPAHKFPTPAELVAKLKARDQKTQTQVAYFDLKRPVHEKPAEFSIFAGAEQGTTLRQLVDRLEKARLDPDVKAVLITLGEGELNLSQALELRDELLAVNKSHKHTYVYADSFDTTSYIVASTATDVCMLEGGQIMLPGVGLQTMFAKGLLDKVGVHADFIQIGEYKGADEQFTRTEPSPELRGELNKLTDSLYGQIVQTIAANRNLPADQVSQLIDRSLLDGKTAKAKGLVDHLVDIDGMRDLIAADLGEPVDKLDLVHDYGKAAHEQVDLSNPFGFLALLTKKQEVSNRPTIALIYAEGMIVDGSSSGGLFGQAGTIGSEDIREAVRIAERDELVQAIVIRIDSPGGSALASEAMWQAVRRAAKTKPVIISIGSMAASGGYYLACSGDYIFADPSAIVGSIGVVGGKFVIKDLLEKVGLNTQTFSRGNNADLFSMAQPWTDDQRKMVHDWMQDTYAQFTQRVMTTRQGKIKEIDQIARGRIFMAKAAKDLGMVDALGGLTDALAYAANKTNLAPGAYDVRVLPPTKTLADLITGGGGAEDLSPFSPRIEIAPDSLLNTLSPAMRGLLLQQVQAITLLNQRPVALLAPYQIMVK